MENKEEIKRILKDVYNEDAVAFKQDFEDIIKSRILDKINDEKTDIMADTNANAEEDPPVETEETNEDENKDATNSDENDENANGNSENEDSNNKNNENDE